MTGRRIYPQLYDRDWLHQRHITDGATIAAIARDVGCTDVPVLLALARAGIPVHIRGGARTSYPRMIQLTRGELVEEYQQAGSVPALAARLGVSAGTVRNEFAHHSIVPGDYTPELFPELKDPDWLARAAETMAVTEIAAKVGCSYSTARLALKAAGVTPQVVAPGPPRTEAGVKTVAVRLYRDGLTTVEVGAAVARHPATVYRWLQAAGVDTKARRRTPRRGRAGVDR
jgi:transposase